MVGGGWPMYELGVLVAGIVIGLVGGYAIGRLQSL